MWNKSHGFVKLDTEKRWFANVLPFVVMLWKSCNTGCTTDHCRLTDNRLAPNHRLSCSAMRKLSAASFVFDEYGKWRNSASATSGYARVSVYHIVADRCDWCATGPAWLITLQVNVTRRAPSRIHMWARGNSPAGSNAYNAATKNAYCASLTCTCKYGFPHARCQAGSEWFVLLWDKL